MAKLLGTAGGTWGAGVWGTALAGSGAYELPGCLVLGDNNVDTKTDTWSLVFADGSYSAGDEVKPRQAILTGTFMQPDRATFRALCDELRYRCSVPGLKLQVNPGAYLNLSHMLSFDEDPAELWDWTVAKVRVSWHCDDPFWYATTPEVRTVSLSGPGTFFIEAGPGAGLRQNHRGVCPQITCTAPGFLPVASFTLRNDTDDGLQLRYSDPYLKNGNSATIDCVQGTATRSDGQNTIRYLEGEFLRLLTRTNRFTYDGPECTLTFSWIPRWL